MAIYNDSCSSSRGPRRAFTLLEIIIAAALLGLLMTASVQVLRAMQMQHLAADRRAAAIQTLQAVAEQVGNYFWKDISTEWLDKLELSPFMTQHLPEAKLIASLTEERDPVPAKRVRLELNWRGPKGQPAGPVRLTIWVFADEAD